MSARHPDSTLSDRIALNLAVEREKAEARRHQTKRRRERRKRAKVIRLAAVRCEDPRPASSTSNLTE